MKKNIGTVDKVLRVVAALAIVVLLLTDTLSGPFAWVLGIVAVVFLLTSAVGICPLYLLFGISTTGKKDPQPASH